MIRKVISNILLGLVGILNNKHLKPKQKILLYIDYFKFILLLSSVLFLKNKVRKVNINSFKYTIYFHNFITFFYLFNEIFCKSIYNPHLLDTFFDLGANIGLTILWYKFFNPNLVITAFEPDKYNFRILRQNIKINKLNNVKINNIALCDKKGVRPFFTILDNIQNLDSGLSLNQKFPYEKYNVKTDKLSNYIHKPIDMVKIDIEGSEYKVFTDLFRTYKINYIKKMVFEMHFFNKSQKEKLLVIINKLNKIGYIRCLDNSEVTKVFYYSSFNQ